MHKRIQLLTFCLFLSSFSLQAQRKLSTLPDAPHLQATPRPPLLAQTSSVANNLAPAPPKGESLTRQQAEQLALKNNPHISVAALLALAQKQGVRVTRSAEFPTLNGEVTGVDAEEASRSVHRLLERFPPSLSCWGGRGTR